MTGKPKVFISYSRKDLVFADRLVSALENREIDVLIDRRDLPALEDWQRELAGFIQAADTVVFIVSPHSIASKVCTWEVEQVRLLAKRLAPVLIAPFEDAPIPADIARINFLSFIDEVDFEKQADALGRSLKIDIGWLKEHTRLSELARRWHVRGKPDDALLRGQDVSDAEGWAARRPREAPVATEQLLSYLDASRNAEAGRLAEVQSQIARTRRLQRRFSVALTGVALLVAAGAIVAGMQTRETAEREARILTSLAQQAIDAGHYDRAMRIAVHGLPPRGALPLVSYWSRELEAKLTGGVLGSRLVGELRGHTQRVTRLQFSADGARLVSSSEDGSTRMWDVRTARQLAVVRGEEPAPTHAAALSPDGRFIATASGDTTARIWVATSGQVLHILRNHTQPVWSVAFSPDGKRLATSAGDGTARVFSVESGEQLATLVAGQQQVWTAFFSPDGARLLTASDVAMIWDIATGTAIVTMRGHQLGVSAATFSGDGNRVLTHALDGTARIWDAATGAEIAVLAGPTPGTGSIDRGPISARFNADGSSVVTAWPDGTARVWDAVGGKEIAVLKGHGRPVVAAEFSPDGRSITTASSDNSAIIWDARASRPLARLAHATGVTAVAYSRDGSQIATATDDGAIRIFAPREGGTALPLPSASAVESAAISSDGVWIATRGGTAPIGIVDAIKGIRTRELKGHSLPVLAHEFNRSGALLISGSFDTTARVWDVRTGSPLAVLLPSPWPVLAVAVSDDGALAATASWGEEPALVRVWRLSPEPTVIATAPQPTMVASLAMSPDARTLAIGSLGGKEGSIRLLDVSSGNQRIISTGPNTSVSRMTFHPDGSRIAAATGDEAVRLWNAASGELVATLDRHGGTVTAIAFDQAGDRIATSSSDGAARLWDADTGTLISRIDQGAPLLANAFRKGNEIIAVTDKFIHARTLGWSVPMRGGELRDRVCAERLIGAAAFTPADSADPFLRGLAGLDPCARAGPLTLDYWKRAIKWWQGSTGPLANSGQPNEPRVTPPASSRS